MKNIFKLVIDIGHNVDFDGGAIGFKDENGLNYQVGTKLIEKCKDVGFTVINCTPSSASSLSDSLNQRVNTANDSKADLFISIHHNACPEGEGSEVYAINGGRGYAVANIILPKIIKLGFKNRGVKNGSGLFVINRTVMPAILIECAFCDSLNDMINYDTERMAEAIFIGVCKAFEIEVNNTNEGDEYYTVLKGDTLWGISKKYSIPLNDLVVLNGIRVASVIRVGERLRIK